MKRLPQSVHFGNETSSFISAFLNSFNIGALLKKNGVYKTKGIPKVFLLSHVRDHHRGICTRGFRLLTPGWNDGNTFILQR